MWNTAQAATPKKGGHLVTALVGGSTTDNMDQQTWVDTFMIAIGRATRDSLVEVGQDNTAQPGLAESWEASDDASEWRFKLRPGVEFSNGKSLTPEDVIASINVHRGEDTRSGAKGVFEPVADVTADGNVVVVKLKGPNADFPFLMTDYHMNVVPAPDGKADLVNGIGTGIYKVTEFEPGVRVAMDRHANSWQADQFGFVDSAEILGVPDPNARQSALVTGDVHAINKPDLKTIKLLARRPNVEIVDVASNYFFTGPMMADNEPFNSTDFRRAIKYGIDRQQFIDKIIFGYGTPGNDHPIGPGFTFHAADIPQTTFDPDKAKHHLKKSGFEGARIDYSASDTAYPGAVDYAVLMKETLAPIGIELNIVREPNDGYWSERLERQAVLRLLLGRPAGRGHDPLDQLHHGRGLERHPLGQPAGRRAGGRRARRARQDEARGDVPRGADADQSGGLDPGAGLWPGRRRALDRRRHHRPVRRRLGDGRRPLHQALVAERLNY